MNPAIVPPATRLAAFALLLAALTACFGDDRPTGPPPPPVEPDAVTVVLGADPASFEVSLPPHARPHAPEPPLWIPLGGWRAEGGRWTTALPFRTRNFYFFRPPTGMEVLLDGAEVPHRYVKLPEAVAYWSYEARTISIHGAVSNPEGAVTVSWPTALERERGLNLATSGLDPRAFVRRTVTTGSVSRTGLLLPAPATATFALVVPPRAELRFAPSLVEPEILDAPPSDGAEIVVQVASGAEPPVEVWRGSVTDPTFRPVRVNLTAWAGKPVRLTVATTPGAAGDARFDYVFLADPVVTTRKEAPRRALLLFVDTLRPDRLGAYGYPRDTSPGIDAIAAAGARFTEARSVAPWTLPSARTMVTGRHPEAWDRARTLARALGDAGWTTAMLGGNIYLGANFGLDRDWGLHDVELLPRASSQVDKALAWLEEESGRDAFLLLHFMDTHLPYEEPRTYRDRYAPPVPEVLRGNEEFHKNEIGRKALELPEVRAYVQGRYDSSLRYLDDELGRLFARLDPSDVVVVVSDHGEEFWEHDGFEHGHTLFDELLRVPFLVRAPGVAPGTTIDAPVSLLDVAPTLLDLLGVPVDALPDLDGTSLLPAMKGDEAALDALRGRDLAFGRPLYGKERWGVLHRGTKWSAISARESAFDLTTDPGERTDLVPSRPALKAEGRAWLAGALGRDVAVAYRVANRASSAPPAVDLAVELDVPGGVRAMWVGDEPTEHSSASVVWSEGATRVRACWPRAWRGSRDVWIVPARPMEQVTHGLRIRARAGEVVTEHRIGPAKPAELPETPALLLKEATGERVWELGFGITPLPLAGGTRLTGQNADVKDELAALGYVTGDEDAARTAPEDDGCPPIAAAD